MRSSAKQESGIEQVSTVGTNHSEVGGLITPWVLPLARLDGSITENLGTSGLDNHAKSDNIQMKAR